MPFLCLLPRKDLFLGSQSILQHPPPCIISVSSQISRVSHGFVILYSYLPRLLSPYQHRLSPAGSLGHRDQEPAECMALTPTCSYHTSSHIPSFCYTISFISYNMIHRVAMSFKEKYRLIIWQSKMSWHAQNDSLQTKAGRISTIIEIHSLRWLCRQKKLSGIIPPQ